MKRYLLLLTLLFNCVYILSSQYLSDPQAVVITVPVVDAVGQSMQSVDKTQSVDELYNKLAYSPEQGKCQRIHQLLFNEVGIIRDQSEEQIKVEFPHFFWNTAADETCNCVWLCARNVQYLRNVENSAVIPVPLQRLMHVDGQKNVLTLLMPWQDEETNSTYSAGTRFVRKEMMDNEQQFAVFILCAGTVKTAFIPRESGIVSYPQNQKQLRKLFVEILKKWAAQASGSVPYVFGGCSFIYTVAPADFALTAQEKNWERMGTPVPHCGFDCSGAILRAAQIAGMPYFYKNTTTIGKQLKDLGEGEDVQEGDLILILGHVVVVADTQQNLIIESAGYSSGFGCLQLIRLSDRTTFSTFAELRRWLKNKDGVHYFKNSAGEQLKAAESIRLLKLIEE